MLVVVSVIALLLAFLLPALSRARKHARAVVCRSHLKQWGTTLALYAEDSDGCFPLDISALPGLSLLRGLQLPKEGPDPDPNNLRRSHAVLTEGVSCCPMATRTVDSTYGYGWLNKGEFYLRVKGGGTFLAWYITIPTPTFRGSYGLNASLFNPMNFGTNDNPMSLFSAIGRGKTGRGVNLHSLRQGYRIPVLLDATIPSYPMLDVSSPAEEEPGEVEGGFCINRHNGTVNALFLDWSVRPVGLKELWTLKWTLKFNTANKWTRAGGVQPEDWPEWMRGFKDY